MGQFLRFTSRTLIKRALVSSRESCRHEEYSCQYMLNSEGASTGTCACTSESGVARLRLRLAFARLLGGVGGCVGRVRGRRAGGGDSFYQFGRGGAERGLQKRPPTISTTDTNNNDDDDDDDDATNTTNDKNNDKTTTER